jgi:hypothetical protein
MQSLFAWHCGGCWHFSDNSAEVGTGKCKLFAPSTAAAPEGISADAQWRGGGRDIPQGAVRVAAVSADDLQRHNLEVEREEQQFLEQVSQASEAFELQGCGGGFS